MHRVQRTAAGAVATMDIADFPSVREAVAWRRSLGRTAADLPGVCLLKPMTMLGARDTGGFGGGRPGVTRQLLLGVWVDDDARRSYETSRLAPGLEDVSWRVVLRPTRTRGALHGRNPFAPVTPRGGPGFAALTLGRATPRSLVRFTRRGMGLEGATMGAPGLVTALTAGWPLTGNATFSLWESEEAMVRFAYGDQAGGHADTVRENRSRPILAEQLNARFEPVSIEGSWDPETTPGAAAITRLAERLHGAKPTAERLARLY